MASTLDEAVTLIKQAVDQDSAKNYKEAAKSYRNAIEIFHHVAESPSASNRLKHVIKDKVVQYEKRLKNLDAHIISQTDLTKLFRDIQRCKPDDKPALGVKSDKDQHHKHPVLVKSLSQIRKGIYEDEQGNYGKALACYEMGLSSMMDVLDSGVLTEDQEKIARTKYNAYQERRNVIEGHVMKTGGKTPANTTKNAGDNRSGKYLEQNESELITRFQELVESNHETHEHKLIHDKQVKTSPNISLMYSKKEVHESSGIPEKMLKSTSLHSLYPTCEIRGLPSDLTFNSGMLAHSSQFINIGSEFGLSSLSIKESALTDEHNKEIELDNRDDTKSQSSDSGYSDESPEDTESRNSRSIDISDDEDEKIPFVNNIEPNVIIVNELTTIEHNQVRDIQPKFDRQKSLFQNPSKDILTSLKSQENLVVLEQEETDFVITRESRTSQSSVRSIEKTEPEIYAKRAPGDKELIPPRSMAQPRGEHENMNKGCYYLMAALDFCWCL